MLNSRCCQEKREFTTPGVLVVRMTLHPKDLKKERNKAEQI